MKIGVIGAGQLGRMLALAGYPLGCRFTFLDRSADAPGAQLGDIVLGGFDDAERLAELAAQVDILTFDVENVSTGTLRRILGETGGKTRFLPPVATLEAGRDRLAEKTLFGRLGIPTPEFRRVDTREDLASAVEDLGLPAVLKTRRFGYDGRGQRVLRAPEDQGSAWDELGGVPLILESFVHFEREVSLIAARRVSGETVYYPLSENEHREGILVRTRAPFEDERLTATARDYLQRLMEHFDYGGILTVEFFVDGGRLLANEMAPRVHNSGHWTIEGAVTSQFENHIRAVADLPLGNAAPRGYAGMVNLIGEMPPVAAALAVDGAHYHDYGKSARPGRKLGHCTVVRDSAAERDAALAALEHALSSAAEPR